MFIIKNIKKLIIPLVACLLFTLTPIASNTYKEGAVGEVVRKAQQKLINWGYMDGTADGVFGSETKSAITAFQKKNGLSADGVIGDETLKALGISASDVHPDKGSRDEDLYLLARIISAEARGEPYIGQVAVGAVVLNRIEHPSFPNTMAGVIYQPLAFSAVADGQFDEPIADSAWKAAEDAINGWDPSGGCLYYYNAEKSTSEWIFTREVVTTIGKHRFAI